MAYKYTSGTVPQPKYISIVTALHNMYKLYNSKTKTFSSRSMYKVGSWNLTPYNNGHCRFIILSRRKYQEFYLEVGIYVVE